MLNDLKVVIVTEEDREENVSSGVFGGRCCGGSVTQGKRINPTQCLGGGVNNLHCNMQSATRCHFQNLQQQ